MDIHSGQVIWRSRLELDNYTLAPGMLITITADGHATAVDLATGGVIRTYTVPVKALPAGYRSTRWLVQGPDHSVFVATDKSGHAVISGLDLVSGDVLWSDTTTIVPRPQQNLPASVDPTQPYVAACGELVCVTDAATTRAWNPSDGSMRLSLPDVRQIDWADGDWIAHYTTDPPSPDHPVEAVAFVDPQSLAAGPRIAAVSILAPFGPHLGVTAVQYVAGDEPQRSKANARDMRVVLIHPDATLTTLTRLPGTDWQCTGGTAAVACVQAKNLTMRVWHQQ
jgi:hypothetical protein